MSTSRAQQRATAEVQRALRSGELTREACEGSLCPSLDVEAHHDDYDRPLDVRWLCKRHHRAWHREHGPGANRGETVEREIVDRCSPQALARWREFHTLTMKQIGEVAGAAPRTIAGWFRGTTSPPLDAVHQLEARWPGLWQQLTIAYGVRP